MKMARHGARNPCLKPREAREDENRRNVRQNWTNIARRPCSFRKSVGRRDQDTPAHLHFVFATGSRTGTAGDDIGVQRDRAIPRQRPAFQIHAGGYCDGCQRQDVSLEYRVCSQGG